MRQNHIFEGILFRMRVGCPWRDIPEAFGSSNTIFKAFRRWSKNNKILKVFKKLIDEPDVEWIFMDASHVRAHQHSAGAFNSENQAISKSAGGNTSKIHLLVDAHGNPLEFIISDGTTHDVKIAPYLINLVDLKETQIVCTDKGYDSANE